MTPTYPLDLPAAEQRALAEDPDTSDALLLALTASEHVAVRRWVAFRTELPMAVADRLAQDSHMHVRAAACVHPLSYPIRVLLAAEPAPRVRCMLLQCPTLTMPEAEQVIARIVAEGGPQALPQDGMSALVRRTDVSELVMMICAKSSVEAARYAALVCTEISTALLLVEVASPPVATQLIERFGANEQVMRALMAVWLPRYELSGARAPTATLVFIELAECAALPDAVFADLPADAAAAHAATRLGTLCPPDLMPAMLALASSTTRPICEVLEATALLLVE